MNGPRSFQLKAGIRWEIKTYKGKPRVVMNRGNSLVLQPIKPYDVLSVSQVRSLAAWLARYLNVVEPTQESVVIAGARAHARGVDRNLEKLEAASCREQKR